MTTYTAFGTPAPAALVTKVGGILDTLDADDRARGIPTIDRDVLVYVCADCGSTGLAAAPEDVAPLRANYDMTCCDPTTTLFV